ncbi:hypothetical protein FRC03_010287 [Tulasnella sp. 419]|nr:hypothetical protein FRC03_010287 [Tulasnella sp. 419]
MSSPGAFIRLPRPASQAKAATILAADSLSKTVVLIRDAKDELPSTALQIAIENVVEIIENTEKTRVEAKYLIELDAYLKQLIEFVIKPLRVTPITAEMQEKVDCLTSELGRVSEIDMDTNIKSWMRRLTLRQDNTALVVELSEILSRALNAFLHGQLSYSKSQRRVIKKNSNRVKIRTEPVQQKLVPAILVETQTTRNSKSVLHLWDQVRYVRHKLS